MTSGHWIWRTGWSWHEGTESRRSPSAIWKQTRGFPLMRFLASAAAGMLRAQDRLPTSSCEEDAVMFWGKEQIIRRLAPFLPSVFSLAGWGDGNECMTHPCWTACCKDQEMGDFHIAANFKGHDSSSLGEELSLLWERDVSRLTICSVPAFYEGHLWEHSNHPYRFQQLTPWGPHSHAHDRQDLTPGPPLPWKPHLSERWPTTAPLPHWL